jgi:hypothetical protein
MQSDSLHTILSHAETLNMPEAEYICVANALKSAFHNINNNTNKITYTTDNIDDIAFYLTNGLGDMYVKNNVKSISASNIKDPGPIKYEIRIISELIYTNNTKKNKIIEYTIYPGMNKFAQLSILCEMIKPKNIYIKFNDIDSDYECYSFLKEWKNRADIEYGINCPDDDDNDMCISDDMFKNIMLDKFIDLCQKWFWQKYNETNLH